MRLGVLPADLLNAADGRSRDLHRVWPLGADDPSGARGPSTRTAQSRSGSGSSARRSSTGANAPWGSLCRRRARSTAGGCISQQSPANTAGHSGSRATKTLFSRGPPSRSDIPAVRIENLRGYDLLLSGQGVIRPKHARPGPYTAQPSKSECWILPANPLFLGALAPPETRGLRKPCTRRWSQPGSNR
jgi:hypothetical protein